MKKRLPGNSNISFRFIEGEGLPPVKLHCSVLAEEAIKEAIADYYRKEGNLSEEEIIVNYRVEK